MDEPTLRAGDLTIRPTSEADLAGIALAGRDPLIQRMPWFGAGFQDNWAPDWTRRARSEWRGGRHYVFSILGAGDRYLGAVVASAPEAGAVEMSYWVLPGDRERGAESVGETGFGSWKSG